MALLHDILTFNRHFVSQRAYEPYQTAKMPRKRLVILSCMDTRLIELLPRAMNLKNGDVKIIKTAGAVVTHPFGSTLRSILIAIYQLHAQEVCVVGHYDCGMHHLHAEDLIEQMVTSGHVDRETLNMLNYTGINIKAWLSGFDSIEESVKNSVAMIRQHPLMPSHIPIHGLIIDPVTGRLDVQVDGYQS